LNVGALVPVVVALPLLVLPVVVVAAVPIRDRSYKAYPASCTRSRSVRAAPAELRRQDWEVLEVIPAIARMWSSQRAAVEVHRPGWVAQVARPVAELAPPNSAAVMGHFRTLPKAAAAAVRQEPRLMVLMRTVRRRR
jgi:hypothetical protein